MSNPEKINRPLLHLVTNDLQRKRVPQPPPQKPEFPSAVLCPHCKGAGFTHEDVPFGHPHFGKSMPCVCTLAKRKERQQEKLLVVSRIGVLDRFKDATFDSFLFTLPGVQAAYRHAKQFASCPMGWLILTGGCGCGKTHLAVAIAKERVQAGDTVLIQTVPDLLDHLRAAYDPHAGETYSARFEELCEVDLLVLDDFGAEQSTSWANEKLFQLLNYRYNASKPTVVTSNNVHLDGIDQRIYSRFTDRDLVCHIKMENAQDYRPRRGQEEE